MKQHRGLQIAAGALVAGLVLAALLAWLAPPLMDWNRYRDVIGRLASDRLGRPVQISGPISLTLLPHPVMTAAGVTVPDTGDGSGADVAELRLEVALGPLLAGRVEAADLTLREPRIRLAWPPAPNALQQRPAAWLDGLHTEIEDGTLLAGGLTVSAISGTVSIDPLTGTLAMDGQVAALERSWRVTARLGRAGGDGSAPLEASLDGQGALLDTGGTLSGQIADDGTLSGLVTGRGRDLAQLLAGPAVAWHASGRFQGAHGVARADALDVEIGGVPAQASVALTLFPALRLQAILATRRLDLDAWLPHLLHPAARNPPTSIDVTADVATLAGATLRHLHAAVDQAEGVVTMRDATATLPGGAALTLTGRLAGDRFDGQGHLAAPALRETLRWAQPFAPALAGALPPGVLDSVTLAGSVIAENGQLRMDGLQGMVDGAAVSGGLALATGPHASLSGHLALTAPLLDPWLPALPPSVPNAAAALARWPGAWGGLDVALVISADHPVWRGRTLDRLDIDAAARGGTLTLRRVAVAGRDLGFDLHGVLAPGGIVSDGQVTVHLGQAALLAPMLPPGWPAPLFSGPATLQADVSGDPASLGVTLQAALGDLRLDADGRADLPRRAWRGAVAVRHPGAPRLLERLGMPGVAAWLGDGSFSLATTLALDPAHVTLTGLALSAGLLHATGDLVLDRTGVPALSGQLAADALPLPLPYAHSPEPLSLASLQGWRAQLGLSAEHVLFGLSPGLDHVTAKFALADGALHMTGLAGGLAGGRLTGEATLDAAATPHLAVQAALAGATLDGGLLEGVFDLTAGALTATASLQARGFSPGALMATLDGTATLSVVDGVLNGLDLAALDAALTQADGLALQAGVRHALAGGSTEFTRLDAGVTVHRGAILVQQGHLTSASGQADLSGTLDLPIDAADFQIALTPALMNAPAIGLRLIGPVASPRRTPELAGLAGWLVGR